MRKTFIYTCITAVMLMACQDENENFHYSTKDNIYFGISSLLGLSEEDITDFYPKGVQDPKNTMYSFALTQRGIDTVLIPVTISGKRVSRDRKFKVSVVADSTTAESDLHYKPFESDYLIPADSGSTFLPVILYNQDPELENKTVSLRIVMSSSEDFDVSLPEYGFAKVSFSNRLERPNWWTNWEGELKEYSRTKHALYLISLEGIENKDLIPNFNGENGLLIPHSLFLIGKFKALLFDPFLWIQDHPGYVIEEREPEVYDFYSTANQFKKYTLKLSEMDGRYYFIDELGRNVSTDF